MIQIVAVLVLHALHRQGPFPAPTRVSVPSSLHSGSCSQNAVWVQPSRRAMSATVRRPSIRVRSTAHGSRYWMSADGMTFMARSCTGTTRAAWRPGPGRARPRARCGSRSATATGSRPVCGLQRFEEHGLDTLLVLLGRTPAPDGPIRSLHPRWLFSHAPFTLLRSVTGLPQASHTGGFSLSSMPIPRGFPYGLSRYRAKTHLNTSHDL
jgi:hypothetical protein